MTVPVFEDRPETARGRMLYETLLAIHALIRRDLTIVERLAAAVLDGLPADGVHEELEPLKSNAMLWQFQVSCLRCCGFVHLHHHAEDTEFFDELEETNPAIGPVVERLRAEHRAVSDYLDAVEAAARKLTEDDSHQARRAVADALEVLKGHLLAHLDYEELNVASTARRLRDLGENDLFAYARQVGLDEARVRDDLERDELWQRVRDDATSALAAGARGTPTLFVDGRLHAGGYDHGTLRATLDSLKAT